MPLRLTPEELLRLRAAAHGFATASPRRFLDVVRSSSGLQAQDATAGTLSARPRTRGLTEADVRRARFEERSVVRTWAMRGTLHFLPAEDLGWLLPLLGPNAIARDRTRLMQLGLDADAVERGVTVIRDALASHGPLTRDSVREALAADGLPAAGQATQHLLYVAALRGFICCSNDRGSGTHEFVLLSDWVELGPPLPRATALAELARRYLHAAGVATVEDFAAWSGLPLRDAREGWDAIREERAEVELAREQAWALSSRLPELLAAREYAPIVRLLPRFDSYLLSYRGRDTALDERHARHVLPGGGILNATVLVDGRLVGVWQLHRDKKRATMTVAPFEPLPPEIYAAIEVETDDLGRFLDMPVAVTFGAPLSSGS
ncbi:MAG: winged helix DNA-binding domain-containing protein [Dehalococcoidia bacterium]